MEYQEMRTVSRLLHFLQEITTLKVQQNWIKEKRKMDFLWKDDLSDKLFYLIQKFPLVSTETWINQGDLKLKCGSF